MQRLFGVLLIAIFLSACASAEKSGVKKNNATDDSYLFKPLLYIIKHHRKYATHMDGPRCPMYPSCAAYAEKALRRYSFMGLLIFIDRLFYREKGNMHQKYMITPERLSRAVRYYDPLEDSLPLTESVRPSLLRENFRQ